MQDFTDAYHLESKKTQGWFFCRAQGWGKKGERDKELAEYDLLLRIDPSFSLGYTARGNAFREKGEYDKAIADYTCLAGLTPEKPRFLRVRTTNQVTAVDTSVDQLIRHLRKLGIFQLPRTCGIVYK